MAVAGLDVNDAGVVLGNAAAVLVESPGFVLEDATGLWVGSAARDRARLSPRLVNDTFWERLDPEPTPRPAGHARTHADLVALHLEHVWERRDPGVDGAILSVPGSLSRAQLGLLLGVAEAIELPVRGLVDAALAALGGGDDPGAGPWLHVEARLHRIVATHLGDAGAPGARGLEATGARHLESPGLLALEEVAARAISARFVHETRFDPRHSGASEQALYAGLRGWLARLARDGVVLVELHSTTGARHAIEVERGEIEAVLAPAVDAIAAELRTMAAGADRLAVGHHLAAMPGGCARLGEALGMEVVALERGAGALGAARLAEAIGRAGGPRTLTRTLARAPASRPAAIEAPPPRPTHVVLDGVAHPIAGERFAIGPAPGLDGGLALSGLPQGVYCVLRDQGAVTVLESSAEIVLNGRSLCGPQPVSAGDRVRLPGSDVELLLVAVRDGPSA